MHSWHGVNLMLAGAQAVQQLLRLAPATAVLLTLDGEGHVVEEEEVPVALVQRGDLLKVFVHSLTPLQQPFLRFLTVWWRRRGCRWRWCSAPTC